MRYLIICLDGVGYGVVEEMAQRGELRHFHRPSRLLATFPSLTNPSLVEMLRPLGAPTSRGYEDYYFDAGANRMRGGHFHRFSRGDFIDGTYREVFDFHPHPIVMTLEYGLPVLGPWISANLSVGALLRRFERSDQPVFLTYVDATDSLSHLGGPKLARGVLNTD
jgi:hypothetical protein